MVPVYGVAGLRTDTVLRLDIYCHSRPTEQYHILAGGTKWHSRLLTFNQKGGDLINSPLFSLSSYYISHKNEVRA